jgi:hypothetical protein
MTENIVRVRPGGQAKIAKLPDPPDNYLRMFPRYLQIVGMDARIMD